MTKILGFEGMSFQLEGICFQVYIPPNVVVLAEKSREKQRKALWNVQQELSKSPEGSSREFLLLLPRNGVVGGPQQGKRVIFE